MKIDSVKLVLVYRIFAELKPTILEFDNIEDANKYFEKILLTRTKLHTISLQCIVNDEIVSHEETKQYFFDEYIPKAHVDCCIQKLIKI